MVKKWEIRMIEIEALQLALSKEEDAIELYKDLLVKHPGLKEVFYQLITEEQKHKILLEKKIAELMR